MATSDPAEARAAYGHVRARGSDESRRFDLAKRGRTSLFPWRGQFSPDLVRLLLAEGGTDGPVLDPFMGSGTVLYEALRQGRDCAGTEINPGAYVFARLAGIAALPQDRRRELCAGINKQLMRAVPAPGAGAALSLVRLFRDSPAPVRDIVEASFLLACRNKPTATRDHVLQALGHVESALVGVLAERGTATCSPDDARYLPHETGSFDHVVTSPPYINVFNYHQQFRPAVEALGYQPLRIATSEIGANRKHRQNRLMTVVQYCLDMSMALDEMSRVTAPEARITLVIGRESRVRKIPFDNGMLLGSLILRRDDITLESRAERKFTSRYGEIIYEDLLFCRRRAVGPAIGDLEFARSVGTHALEVAMTGDLENTARSDAEQAVDVAADIAPSPRAKPASAGLVAGIEGEPASPGRQRA